MNNRLQQEKDRAQQRANDERTDIYLFWCGYDYHTTNSRLFARAYGWDIITVCYPEALPLKEIN